MITKNGNELLSMQPVELIEELRDSVLLELPAFIENDHDRRKVVKAINEATSLFSFFSEMELRAKDAKRQAKKDKEHKEEFDRCLGVEEIFHSYKEVSNKIIEQASKLMTMKRLELDEFKMYGNTV